MDGPHAASAGWLAAQAADPEFISTYARDNPTREDIAESLDVAGDPPSVKSHLHRAVQYHRNDDSEPARLLDRQLELYPIVPATAPTAVVAATNVSARSATLQASIDPEPARFGVVRLRHGRRQFSNDDSDQYQPAALHAGGAAV